MNEEASSLMRHGSLYRKIVNLTVIYASMQSAS